MTLTLLKRQESLDDCLNQLCVAGAHWPITETAGTVITDTSQNWLNGTLSGTVTLNNTIAPDGRAAALFGGGHIAIADAAALSVHINNGLTVGALVKFDSIPTATRWIVTKGTTSNYEWALLGNSAVGDGQLQFTTWTSASVALSSLLSTNSPITTSWALLIARVQNRTAQAKVDLFYNGAAPTLAAAVGSGAYTDGTSAVRIGARADDAVNVMNGYIRNAFMTPEALSNASIARITAACQREGWF